MPPTSKRPWTLEDLNQIEGLLTTTDVALMLGMSPTFIRKEIKDGQLRATRFGRGRKRVFRIRPRDVAKYAAELGLLRIRVAG